MKKSKGLWILAGAFVVLLLGAGILSQRLGSEMQPDRLQTAHEDGDPAAEETGQTQAQTEGENGTQEESAQEPVKIAAPDFTVQDYEGNQVKLSDFKGKPVIVNFWASWCGPCKSEMPDFDEVYAEYGDEVQFMMVNLTDGSRETVESAKAYIEEQGYSFPVYFDTESEGAIAYGVMAIPTTSFIDEEGNAVAQAMSALDRDTIQQGIDMILQ